MGVHHAHRRPTWGCIACAATRAKPTRPPLTATCRGVAWRLQPVERVLARLLPHRSARCHHLCGPSVPSGSRPLPVLLRRCRRPIPSARPVCPRLLHPPLACSFACAARGACRPCPFLVPCAATLPCLGPADTHAAQAQAIVALCRLPSHRLSPSRSLAMQVLEQMRERLDPVEF